MPDATDTPPARLLHPVFGVFVLFALVTKVVRLGFHPLLASSYVMCTFQVRPFSSSLEPILLSLCLVLLQRIVDRRTRIRVGRKNMDDQARLYGSGGEAGPIFSILTILGHCSSIDTIELVSQSVMSRIRSTCYRN